MAKRKKKAKKSRLPSKIPSGVGAMENIVMDLPATPPPIVQSPTPKGNPFKLILIAGVGIVVLLAIAATIVFLVAQL